MDPISVVGLAGTLLGIGDVAARSIRSLINIQSKFRSSSLVISLLIGQLTTLRAALNQIMELVSSSLISVPVHEQLVTDLQVSMESCHVLIFVLEEQIEKLGQKQDDGHGLTTKGKMGFLLEEGELNEFTNHLNNQVNALNLLLTAFHCRTTFERNELLCNNESRQIIKKVEDNRTSLLSLRDTGSQYTRSSTATENWSLLDREFDFDQEVITTNVYRAALKFNMKKAIPTPKGKRPLLNNSFLAAMPEDVEYDSEDSQEPQSELHDKASHQEWPLQSPPLHLQTEVGTPSGGLISETQEADHFPGQRNRDEETKTTTASLNTQFGNPVEVVNDVSTSAPGTLRLFFLKIRQNIQLALRRKSESTRRLQIRKIFPTSSSLDVPKFEELPLPVQPARALVLGSNGSGK